MKFKLSVIQNQVRNDDLNEVYLQIIRKLSAAIITKRSIMMFSNPKKKLEISKLVLCAFRISIREVECRTIAFTNRSND
jgi:hypothetical protein